MLGDGVRALVLAERAVAYRWALPIGAASVALFLALRLAGGFGSIRPALERAGGASALPQR